MPAMTERTDRLARLDQWSNLRERMLAGWALGTVATLALLLVSEGDQETATGLPLSILFAAAAGLAAGLVGLFVGMAVRWSTLPSRVTLPACWILLLTGSAFAVLAILRTADAPRAPIGTADLQQPAAFIGGVLCAVFAAANWPARRRD